MVENFLDLSAPLSDCAAARYVVLPAPYGGTVCYKSGTEAGPAAVLAASAQVELFDEELGGEFVEAGIATHASVTPAPAADGSLPDLRDAAEKLFAAGKFVLSLGGEHTITTALVAAARQDHPDLCVLQIDAHADLRDSYQGTGYSHACVMRRLLEMGCAICQVGVRSYSLEEAQACGRQVERFITPGVIESDPQWIDRVLDRLAGRVYVTLDMDALDPSIAPGVGTPEPGGLSWRQVRCLLRRVCSERQVVGADIVEVRPLADHHVTEFVAARLAYKIIAYTQLTGR